MSCNILSINYMLNWVQQHIIMTREMNHFCFLYWFDFRLSFYS